MLDQNKIEEFKALETKEAKAKLEEYGKEFGIDLKRNKSFENMLESLEAHVEANTKEDASEELVDTQESSEESQGESSEDVQESDSAETSEDISENEESTEESSESDKSEETSEDEEKSDQAQKDDEAKEEVKEVDLSAPGEEVEIPEGFKPKFNLSFYNRGKGFRFASLGYWVVDEINKLGDNWKCKADKSRYSKELLTIIYYIRRYGEVTIRESRNSQYITFK